MNLTPKQLNVLRFVRKFRDSHEYAPTLEDYVLPQTADIISVARRLAAY